MSVGNPLVTVYIPTRNRSVLLERALLTVIAQTYENIEIIVVDDCSDDDTLVFLNTLGHSGAEINKNPIAGWMAKGKLLVLAHEEPLGACQARNAAIDVAKGTLITGLDDDDEMLPTHIEQLVHAYMNHQVSCVASTSKVRTSNALVETRYGAGKVNLDDMLHSNKLGNQVLTETSRLRAIGGFDIALPAFQDYDAWLRLLQHFGPAYKIAAGTYIVDKTSANRISGLLPRREAGWQAFNSKHDLLMSRRHRQSQRLIRLSFQAGRVSMLSVLRNLNRQNWRLAAILLKRSLLKGVDFE